MEQIKIEEPSSYNIKKANSINNEIKTNLDMKDSKLNINKEKSSNSSSRDVNNVSNGNSNINNLNISQNGQNNVFIVESKEPEMLKIYLSIRSKFMLKVYGILLFQFIFTFGIILICQIKIIKKYLLSQKTLCISLLAVFAFVYLFAFTIFLCRSDLMRRVPINYIVIVLITICETIVLTYISIFFQLEIIIAAITFLTAICLAIFFISLFNQIDIKNLYMTLITLFFCALNYGILALIYRSNYLYFLYCLIAAIFYTLFIVYDTTIIRDDFDLDDYAYGALTLYFDIIRLFIIILQIIGNFRGNRK
jgi:FtsH-binding integral membrane protein